MASSNLPSTAAAQSAAKSENPSGAAPRCETCYGTGEVGGQHGVTTCTDCGGLGSLPSPMVLVERRLRDLESLYVERGGQVGADIQWLVDEVRRSRHALVQILAAGADDEGEDENSIAFKTRFIANDVLNFYVLEEK